MLYRSRAKQSAGCNHTRRGGRREKIAMASPWTCGEDILISSFDPPSGRQVLADELVAEHLLVLLEGALEHRDGSWGVLRRPGHHDPQLIRHQRHQAVVVTDEDDAALKLVQCHGQTLDRFQIQVIRRLIQQEEMGRRPSQLRERQPAFLPSAQVPYRLQRQVTLESEAAQIFSSFLDGDLARAVILDAAGAQSSHVHHGVLIQIHAVDMVLGKSRQNQLRVPPDEALGRLQSSVEQLQEGGFTRAVGTDDGDPRIAIHSEIQVLIQYPVLRITEGCIDDRDTWRR
mmetsp:Transcript_114967/g.330185  ORF Transcript_114967/g.330185 Transcript_114967/m.330185 type:complete len:286 (+) Transcript_114967:86-943(+)